MKHSLRLAVLLAVLLVVTSCGDDDAVTTTVPDETTVPTTGGETTTIPEAAEPFGEFLTAGVADPFFDSGYHQMQWADDTHQLVVSTDELPGGGRLILGDLGLPAATGLEPEQRLVQVWVDESPADIPPFAVALYRLTESGWTPDAVFRNDSTLGSIAETTDYKAKVPAGPVVLHSFPSAFSWDGSSARMIAGVEVYDDLAATNVVFTGEVECAITPEGGGCILISDDGVLRPGDDTEAVRFFEEDLAAIGYFPFTPDTIYDATTEEWVRRFQRDYRLTIDGKAGPQTIALADDVLSGASNIVMAYQEGVGGVSFGTLVETALPALIAELGPPDYTVGWEMGPCGPTPPYGGWEWYKVTWGGFTAWFTEHDGPRQFDGWEVTDLSDVPSNLYFVGGIAPGWTWSQLVALGATYDDFYGWWYLNSLEYRQGTFVVAPPGNPPNSAQILGWGVGTASVLYDC